MKHRGASPFARCYCGPTLAVLLALFMAGYAVAAEDEAEELEKQPPEVPVQEVRRTHVFVERTYTGRTEGAQAVEIRTQVGGVIEERRYTEGSIVESGAELFQINPAPYEAVVRSAEAELEVAQARQRQTEREWQRVSDLYEDNATSGRERDLALSERELADAEVAKAEAELAAANLDLDYTTIESPLRGVAGMEDQPVGSLLDEGDLLTTVTELDPVHVRFSIPAADMAAYGPQFRSSSGGISVTLAGRDGNPYSEPGRVDFIAAIIDETTGTVPARAVFPNPGERLLAGQFVRLTFAGLYEGRGFRIPYEAVVEVDDDRGHAVYVLDDENRAQRRLVDVQVDLGDAFLISTGLKDGDRVVLGAIGRVDAGEPVTPKAAPREYAENPPDLRWILHLANEADAPDEPAAQDDDASVEEGESNDEGGETSGDEPAPDGEQENDGGNGDG